MTAICGSCKAQHLHFRLQLNLFFIFLPSQMASEYKREKAFSGVVSQLQNAFHGRIILFSIPYFVIPKRSSISYFRTGAHGLTSVAVEMQTTYPPDITWSRHAGFIICGTGIPPLLRIRVQLYLSWILSLSFLKLLKLCSQYHFH